MKKVYWQPWIKFIVKWFIKLHIVTFLYESISNHIIPWVKNKVIPWIREEIIFPYIQLFKAVCSINIRNIRFSIDKQLLRSHAKKWIYYFIDLPYYIADWYNGTDKQRLFQVGMKCVLMVLMIVPFVLQGQHHDTVEHITDIHLTGWEYVTIAIFSLVIIGLFLEDKWHHLTGFNKTWTVITGAFLMSMTYFIKLVTIASHQDFEAAIMHASGPTFQLLCFLLLAMWIVEHIVRQGGVNYISKIIIDNSKNERVAFTLIYIGVFVLSPWIDNVLAALVGYSLARTLFKNKETLLLVTAAIIISSNAGGAFFPTGDPPVLLAWIANLLNIPDMIKYMAVPSVLFAIPMYVAVYFRLSKEDLVIDSSELIIYKNSGKMFFLGILCIMLIIPLRVQFPQIPPYIALLGSYSLFWIISSILNRSYNEMVAPRESMPDYLSEGQQIEWVTTKQVKLKDHLNMLRSGSHVDVELLGFFLGLLTCVAILELNNVLGVFATLVDNNVAESIKPIVYGASSSAVDNVAMEAATIAMYKGAAMSLKFWIKTTFYICVGGCLLITGTASGVALMERSGLTMGGYIKRTIIPVIIGLLMCEFLWFRLVL